MDYIKISKVVEACNTFHGVMQVTENGETKLHIAKGYAKREDELPIKVDTSFGIASGTKGFTALATLKLIDDGKLSLDDSVFDILPYEFPNIRNKVTVKQLLSHTSGIYDYFDEDVIEDFGQLFEKVPIHKIHGPKDMLPLLTSGECYFKPGTKFKYCNSGFVILGMLIEVVSKMPYSNYLDKYVIKALKLCGTGCYKTNQLPKNTAYGYMQGDDGSWYSNIFEIPMVCTADGGLFTTTADVTKMWTGFIKGDFLSKKIKDEALKIQVKREEHKYYGLGFYIEHDKDDNLKNYSLVGGDPGVSFLSCYYVKNDRIMTIIGNTSDSVWDLLNEIRPLID